jgi:hypothetical protein
VSIRPRNHYAFLIHSHYRKLLIALALVAIAGALAAVAQTGGKPAKITWSSPDVYAGITSTTTVVKTITFTSDQAMQNVRLEAVPEIARFVNIQPATFTVLPKGQPQTVRLTFSASVGAKFGAYDGTIHLRDGNATRPQTLKTGITFAVVTLPPDPGEVGKKTLEGIDSDGDGIRDDIQRFIAFTYVNSLKTRAALTQYARTEQTFLAQANNEARAIAAARLRSRAADCTDYVRGLQQSIADRGELRAQFLNTSARTRAYLKADGLLGGEVFWLTPEDELKAQCTFNPDAMEN